MKQRSLRVFPLIGAIVVVSLLVVSIPLSEGVRPSESSSSATLGTSPLPALSIIFAANSTAEVESLIKDKPYIDVGDSFDLDSGSPSTLPLNVTAINSWASLLHKSFPEAAIYAHTSGISHLETLAAGVSSNIAGIYYDYEPNYEPEFTTNFSQTVSQFYNATAIAHAHGLVSVGYPFGRPIQTPGWTKYDWNYAELSQAVDVLVIQTQRYCHSSTASFESAVATVLSQFAADSMAVGPPVFQITIGNDTTYTPNQVGPFAAYECAQVLTNDHLKSLYLWWGPTDPKGVVDFLRDIGRTRSG